MLFKPPHADPGECHGTKRWATNFNVFLQGQFYPVDVWILHMVPSYEIIDVGVDIPDDLAALSVADYAKYVVLQQSMSEFSAFAEEAGAAGLPRKTNERRTANRSGIDPSLFS